MATRADFSADQWQTLGFAVEEAVMLVSLANGTHFFESMAEIGASARFLAEQSHTSRSTLVRDLAGGIGMQRDRELGVEPSEFERTVLRRVAEAIGIVAAIDESELPAFKEFLLGVADSAAEARHGIDQQEATAIEKLKSAML